MAVGSAKRGKPPQQEKQLLSLVEEIATKSEDTRESVNKLARIMDLHKQKTEFELSTLKETATRNARELERHVSTDNSNVNELMGFLKQISEQAHETKECFLKLDKKLDLEIQKLDFEVRNISRLDVEVRLNTLEEPKKWWNQTTQKLTIWGTFLGGLFTVLAAVARYFHWI